MTIEKSLNNENSIAQTKEALVNVLLKQYDSLTESAFNDFYDQVTKTHTKEIVTTLRNKSGKSDSVVVKELKLKRETIDLNIPPQTKLTDSYKYFCENVSESYKKQFENWYKGKVTLDRLDNIGKMEVAEISYDEIYDKLEELADYDAKNKANWTKDKEKINLELKLCLKKSDPTATYTALMLLITEPTKIQFNEWIKQRASLEKIRAKALGQLDTLCQDLGFLARRKLKKSLTQIVESGFDQKLIDELNLSAHTKEFEESIAKFLNSEITNYKIGFIGDEAEIINDYLKNLNKNSGEEKVFLAKISGLSQEDYKNKYENAINVEEEKAKEKIDDFVKKNIAEKAEFEKNIKDKNPDQLLNILARTTKSIERTANAEEAQKSLQIMATYTEEAFNVDDVISGPLGISHFLLDEARKVLNNSKTDVIAQYNEISTVLSRKSKNKLQQWLSNNDIEDGEIPKMLADFLKIEPRILSYFRKRQLRAKLNSLLDEEEQAIQNSLLGKARKEYAKMKVQQGWVDRAYEHAQGFSVACALTMAGSIILLLIGVIFFSVPVGLFTLSTIVLLGVYLGNWWITKHDVAELFLIVFNDASKHWLVQFYEEGKKNTFSFVCSNLSAFMSALFTAIAAYAVIAVALTFMLPAAIATWPIWVIGGIVAAVSFYYTYPTYFAISHIFLRMVSSNTLNEHLDEVEEVAIINDRLGIRKYYPVFLFLAMLAIWGVMLAAAPYLFVGGTFLGLTMLASQIIGYTLVTLAFFGIGTFYAYRTKFAAIKVMNQEGTVPFKGMKEQALCELKGEMSPAQRLLLLNMVDKITNHFINDRADVLANKLKTLINYELNPIGTKPANLSAEEIAKLQANQTTLGKIYRIYENRKNAQEALTIWDKSFGTIRWVNALGNSGPSVFGLMVGLSSLGIPPAILGILGVAGFVGGTGASWAANANGIEKDYTVKAELDAAKSHLQDCTTIAWYSNLKALENALKKYEAILDEEIKNPSKYTLSGQWTKTDKLHVCHKLYLMVQEIKEHGVTQYTLSTTEKAIAKNGRLGKIYREMGKHVLRAVNWQNVIIDNNKALLNDSSPSGKIRNKIIGHAKSQFENFNRILTDYKTTVTNAFLYTDDKRKIILGVIDKLLNNTNEAATKREIFQPNELAILYDRDLFCDDLTNLFQDNLNEAERAQVTNQISVKSQLDNLNSWLTIYIASRKEGGEFTRSKSQLYSWLHTTNWGTKTRGQKVGVAEKLQKAVQDLGNGYTDVTFDETEKEILRDGNLGEIYNRAEPLLGALQVRRV